MLSGDYFVIFTPQRMNGKRVIYERLEVFSWEKMLEIIESNIPPRVGKSFSMFLTDDRSILFSYTIDGILHFQYFMTF